ncbi:MAG: hypothetical protein Q8M58_14815, partial [Anaerolineales bacterium]|nr:hypothetical protein [Anaerolineales bacterium]
RRRVFCQRWDQYVSNSQFGFVVTTSVVVCGQKATEVATTSANCFYIENCYQYVEPELRKILDSPLYL